MKSIEIKGIIQAHLPYRNKLAEFTRANRFSCGAPFSNYRLRSFFFSQEEYFVTFRKYSRYFAATNC
jgi:hypothetical protein